MAITGIGATPENNVLQTFSDAAAGRSIQCYYGIIAQNQASTDYILTRDGGNSYPLIQESAAGAFDVDFDLTINKPTIFAGIAYIDFNQNLRVIGTPGVGQCYITFTVYHYDGVTETSLGTVTTLNLSGSATTNRISKVKIAITRKSFKIGDTLRLTAYGALNAGAYATHVVGLHCDPSTAGNELKLNMPIVNME